MLYNQYRPLIFVLAWTLVLGLLSLVVLVSTGEHGPLTILVPVLLLNIFLLVFFAYKEKRELARELRE